MQNLRSTLQSSNRLCLACIIWVSFKVYNFWSYIPHLFSAPLSCHSLGVYRFIFNRRTCKGLNPMHEFGATDGCTCHCDLITLVSEPAWSIEIHNFWSDPAWTTCNQCWLLDSLETNRITRYSCDILNLRTDLSRLCQVGALLVRLCFVFAGAALGGDFGQFLLSNQRLIDSK